MMRYMIARLTGRGLVIAVAIFVAWSASLAVGATEYDGKYAGVITCDAIPGQTIARLKTDFLVKIGDGQAQYERQVLQPNSTMPLGVTERGTGTVSPSGEVSLTGSASGQGWSYNATYRGQFAGKNLRLSGNQSWRLPGGAAHTRPCTITVSKAE